MTLHRADPRTSEPTADHDGFTDAAGRHQTYEDGIRNAARCIVHQGDVSFVEDLIRLNLSPDEVLVWLVYPDTGEFADTIGVSDRADPPC